MIKVPYLVVTLGEVSVSFCDIYKQAFLIFQMQLGHMTYLPMLRFPTVWLIKNQSDYFASATSIIVWHVCKMYNKMCEKYVKYF